MITFFKKKFHKFKNYLPIINYLPKNFFLENNIKDIPVIVKILNRFINPKLIPSIQNKENFIRLSNEITIKERRRKILIEDKKNKLIIHSFYSSIKKKNYENVRDNVENELKYDSFNFCSYISRQHFNEMLVVIEKKAPGVSLDDCNPRIIEKFLNIFLELTKKKKQSFIYSNDTHKVYNSLHLQNLLLQKKISTDSSFFKLNEICKNPFSNEKGDWPSQYIHAQLLPPNILYEFNSKNKFYLIDFEPKLIGIGPYAYDFTFFILYSLNLISNNYTKKIKKDIFNSNERINWAQNFLAQIVWWSRKRKLNSIQLDKIESRSSTVLSFLDINR